MNNVINTKVSIFRNLKDYKFVPKLSNEHKSEIIAKVEQALKGEMSVLNLGDAGENVINQLKNNSLVLPNVSTIFISKKNVSINMFDGEHLHIVSTGDAFSKNIYNNAKKVADLLANKLNLAFNDEYGFLMSDISKIGSGIRFEATMCLECLRKINKIDQVKQNIRKLGYLLKETETVGIYTISTVCNLGYGEKEICEEFEKMLGKLEDLEIESAKMLDVSNHDELVDKSFRSLAILNSAYLMSCEELMKHIINLRTGLNLKLIEMNKDKLNQLQKLVFNKNSNFVSQTELKDLADKVKNILKGE